MLENRISQFLQVRKKQYVLVVMAFGKVKVSVNGMGSISHGCICLSPLT